MGRSKPTATRLASPDTPSAPPKRVHAPAAAAAYASAAAAAAASAPRSLRPPAWRMLVDDEAELSSEAEADDECQVCRRPDGARNMVMCDGCFDGYHVHCMNPPRATVPRGSWYCPKCFLFAKARRLHLTKVKRYLDTDVANGALLCCIRCDEATARLSGKNLRTCRGCRLRFHRRCILPEDETQPRSFRCDMCVKAGVAVGAARAAEENGTILTDSQLGTRAEEKESEGREPAGRNADTGVAAKPIASKPDAPEPGAEKRGVGKRGAEKRGVTKRNAAKRGAAKRGAAKRGVPKRGEAKPDAPQPDAPGPDVPGPAAPGPDAPGPDSAISGAAAISGVVAISGVAAISGAAEIPGAPSIPDTVAMSGTAANPDAAKIPGAPSIPDTVAMSGTAANPDAAEIPGAPSIPDTVAMSGTAANPDAAATPGAAEVPGVAAIPGAAPIPGAAAMPGAAAVHGEAVMPGESVMPGTDALPGAAAIPGETAKPDAVVEKHRGNSTPSQRTSSRRKQSAKRGRSSKKRPGEESVVENDLPSPRRKRAKNAKQSQDPTEPAVSAPTASAISGEQTVQGAVDGINPDPLADVEPAPLGKNSPARRRKKGAVLSTPARRLRGSSQRGTDDDPPPLTPPAPGPTTPARATAESDSSDQNDGKVEAAASSIDAQGNNGDSAEKTRNPSAEKDIVGTDGLEDPVLPSKPGDGSALSTLTAVAKAAGAAVSAVGLVFRQASPALTLRADPSKAQAGMEDTELPAEVDGVSNGTFAVGDGTGRADSEVAPGQSGSGGTGEDQEAASGPSSTTNQEPEAELAAAAALLATAALGNGGDRETRTSSEKLPAERNASILETRAGNDESDDRELREMDRVGASELDIPADASAQKAVGERTGRQDNEGIGREDGRAIGPDSGLDANGLGEADDKATDKPAYGAISPMRREAVVKPADTGTAKATNKSPGSSLRLSLRRRPNERVEKDVEQREKHRQAAHAAVGEELNEEDAASGQGAEINADDLPVERLRRSADKLADEPADTPADMPADSPTDKPANDKPADDTPADDKPADDKPIDKLADEPADKPTDKPGDVRGDVPGDVPGNKPVDAVNPSSVPGVNSENRGVLSVELGDTPDSGGRSDLPRSDGTNWPANGEVNPAEPNVDADISQPNGEWKQNDAVAGLPDGIGSGEKIAARLSLPSTAPSGGVLLRPGPFKSRKERRRSLGYQVLLPVPKHADHPLEVNPGNLENWCILNVCVGKPFHAGLFVDLPSKSFFDDSLRVVFTRAGLVRAIAFAKQPTTKFEPLRRWWVRNRHFFRDGNISKGKMPKEEDLEHPPAK